MRFDDDYDDSGGGLPIIYMALLVSAFILAVLGVVIFTNKKKNSSPKRYQALIAENQTSAEEIPVITPKLYAEDLDIWNMYPERESTHEQETETTYESEEVAPTPSVSPEADDDKYDDGKHFKIKLSDGSTEWISIDSKRTKNTYDFMNLKSSDGKLKYYSDDKVTSFVGVDISRYQKDVDFEQIKNSGIEFVMIRVGSRGYQTGLLALDECFEKNIKGAIEAGLDVGVYFYSQAISQTEAIEEANLVINALNEYRSHIKYPVAFVMEPAENDMARIDSLTKDARQVIAATYINTVGAAGYKTLLFGDEEWLVKKLDLNNFPNVSIWLSDDSDMPDYPYQFALWRYTTTGKVTGISGDVNMDICFIDYSAQ